MSVASEEYWWLQLANSTQNSTQSSTLNTTLNSTGNSTLYSTLNGTGSDINTTSGVEEEEVFRFSEQGFSEIDTWVLILQITTLCVIIISSILVNVLVFLVFYRKPLLLTIFNHPYLHRSPSSSIHSLIHFFMFQITTLCVIIISSILVNVLVFLVFYRKPLLLTISNRFVLNLAAASFLLSVLVMPQALATSITTHWPLGPVWCQVTGALSIVLFAASIATLLLISVDRFFAIMKPLHYGMCVTARRATLLLVCVWGFALTLAVPPLVGFNRVVYQQPFRVCTVDWENQTIIGRIYSYIFVVVCFIVPVCGMLWVYGTATQQAKLTIAKARRNSVTTDQTVDLALAQAMLQQRRRSSTVSLFQIVNSPLRRRSTASSISSRRSLSITQGDDWKAARTGVICMSTFLICWAPFFTVVTILGTGYPRLVPPWLGVVSAWMAFSSCTLNPLVYVFRNAQIRRQVASLLCCGGKARLLHEHRINTASPHSFPQLTVLANGSSISRTSSVVTFHTVDMKQAPLLQL